MPICRHCSHSKVNRPRGLCWHCYYTPGLKDLYPSTSKHARRGFGNFTGCRPLPDSPTTAVPGTPEKLAVMEERARLGQAMFHPADSRYPGDPRPLEFIDSPLPSEPQARESPMPKQQTYPPATETPLYWFLKLELAVEARNFEQAAQAQRQLARLGVEVRYLPRIAAAAGGSA